MTASPGGATRILLLVSSPLTENPVDFDRALSRLTEALAEVVAPAVFQAMVAEPDAVSALLVRRNRPPFQVLHYFGHGAQPDLALNGKLVFEDGTGGGRGLDASRLRAVLNPTNRPAPEFAVAVLTACHSESVAGALHDLGVRHIVAVDARESVTDVAAIAFFRRFYQVLLTGGVVRESFDAGCNAVRLDDDILNRLGRAKAEAEANKFKLLPADVPHDAPLLAVGAGDERAAVELLPSLTADPFHKRPASFVGRAGDLHAVVQRLKAHRAILIQGVSGVGKTELAKETARWLVARRWIAPAGVRFVPLGYLQSAETARAVIALAVGLQPEALPADAAAADAALAAAVPAGTLLVLDEAENVVAKGGLALRELLEALIRAPARPLVVVTSQSDVGSAHLPRYVLERLNDNDALELFARTANLTDAELRRLDRAELVELLGYVDRLPRAVELVARQWRHRNSPGLGPLLADLRRYRDETLADPHYPDAVKSVTVGVRLAYERLRSLNPAAAVLYTLLPLFPGGVPEEGVAAIFGAEGRRLLPLIENESLLERPLPDLLYVPAPFRFFAERQFPGGLAAARVTYGPAALCFYFDFEEEPHRGWAVRLNEALTTAGDALGGVIGRYALELPSIEAWLDWAYEAEPCNVNRSRAARLTALLENLYVVTGLLRFQADRLAAALASARRCADKGGEANVRKALGDLALREADLAAARRHYEAALAIYPGIGDRLGEANVRKALGDLALREDDLAAARRHYEAALAIYPGIGARLGEANVRKALGDLALREADLAAARRHYEAALAIYPGIGDRLGEANVRKALGDLALREDDLAAARRHYEAALAIYPGIGARLGEANVRKALGDLALREADLAAARRHYEAALAIYPGIGDRLGEANVLEALGDLALREADLAAARRHYEAALAIYPGIGDRLGEANVRKALGDLALREDDLAAARRHYEAALAIYPGIGARLGEAMTLRRFGHLEFQLEDYERAGELYGASLTLCKKISDRLGEAYALRAVGDVELHTGDLSEAECYFFGALSLFRRINDHLGEANTLISMGELALTRHNEALAQTHATEAGRIYDEIGEREGQAEAYALLGRARADSTSFERALALNFEIMNRSGVADVSYHYGLHCLAINEIERAQALLQQAENLWRAVGLTKKADRANLAIPPLCLPPTLPHRWS